MARLKNTNLLFLENNKEFAKNTIQTLEIYFDKVYHSPTIKDALIIFEDLRVNVIISDIKVDDGNGLDFIKKVRSQDKNIPIIILSAHKDEAFLFEAIGLNLLSYELKPLSYERLLNVLEMIKDALHSRETFYIEKDIVYNAETGELNVRGENIGLTKREVLFMELLIKFQNKVITYELIQKDIWEDKAMSVSALKNFILRFRKKSKISGLHSMPNMGYKFSSFSQDL